MVSEQASQQLTEKFHEFYRRYYDSRNGGSSRIGDLAQKYPKEEKTLWIDYDDLYNYDPDLAGDLLEQPEPVLSAAEVALQEYDLPADVVLDDARVRIENIEAFSDAEIYTVGGYPADEELGLIGVRGQVNKVAQSRGRLNVAVFECLRCGVLQEIPQQGSDLQEPTECPQCERQGPFDIDWDESVREDYQLIRLQRPPEKSRNGAQTDTIDIELTNDLVGTISAGDRVNVATKLVPELDEDNKATYSLYGEANAAEKQQTDFEDLNFEEHMDEIQEIASRHNPLQSIVDSIKPSHKGHEEIKEAIALQMFGGVKKHLPDGDVKRGNSHILLVGDPGVDKSGLLNYAKQLSPRSVYTSGKNATSAGLTCAAVQTDFGDGGWTLEAGALVQAHKGLCAIDEFDKMDDEDRAGVQEALANGTISPSKAGITNVSLPAEATVLAAANPEYGRFEQYEPIGEQINLDPTLISRFDLIFTMQDEPDPDTDRELADHLNKAAKAGELNAAGKSLEGSDMDAIKPEIEPEVMQHYIAYAKQEISPVLSDEAMDMIEDFYAQIRSQGVSDDSPVPVTARKVEALHRLAEASARVRLSETVTSKDADRAIRLARSCLEDVGVDPETGDFDADVVETGTSKSQRDRIQVVRDTISELENQYEEGAPIEKVVESLISDGFENKKAREEIKKLKRKGNAYEPRKEHIRVT